MWPRILISRELASSGVLCVLAPGVAPGLFDDSISNFKLRGINASSVLAPYTFAMFSFVFGLWLVAKAMVFFLQTN